MTRFINKAKNKKMSFLDTLSGFLGNQDDSEEEDPHLLKVDSSHQSKSGLASSHEIHTGLNCSSIKIFADLVGALGQGPIESSRVVTRVLQSEIENTELSKESYHSTTLLLELLFQVYRQCPELLASDWSHLITFSTNIFTEASKEELAELIQEKKKAKIGEKPGLKQKNQLNEYLSLLFLDLLIHHIEICDKLPGYIKVFGSLLGDLQSTSMEITAIFFGSFGSKMIALLNESAKNKVIHQETWLGINKSFTSLCSTLDQKNLETVGAEITRKEAFNASHNLFRLGLGLVKDSHASVDSIVPPLLDTIKHLCASKIGNSTINYNDLLNDFQELSALSVPESSTTDSNEGQPIASSSEHSLTFKIFWSFVFFMLQGEALDLKVSTGVLRNFLSRLDVQQLKFEDKLKILQVVRFNHPAVRFLGLDYG